LGKEPFKLFVAEADGRVVGTTMVNMRGKIGYVAAVMVHPIYRRKGIATKLVKSALNYIQKKRLSRAILHVASKNTPAKSLYRKLGFEKFENTVYLVAEIDSFRKPQNVKGVLIRNFEKKDIEAVYNLIKSSEDPTHLKVFDFKRKDLETPLIKRIVRFSTDKKIVAIKNNKIVGYAEASYTTAKEAGYIRNIQVYPDMRAKGIEEMLISAGVDHIREVGTDKVIAVTLSKRLKLIEKMKQLGFAKYLEMEAMIFEIPS
jgi:ribosomal protein S18 acetylase RimI-like enzyme